MITHVSIKDFAIIENIDIEFFPGFNRRNRIREIDNYTGYNSGVRSESRQHINKYRKG